MRLLPLEFKWGQQVFEQRPDVVVVELQSLPLAFLVGLDQLTPHLNTDLSGVLKSRGLDCQFFFACLMAYFRVSGSDISAIKSKYVRPPILPLFCAYQNTTFAINSGHTELRQCGDVGNGAASGDNGSVVVPGKIAKVDHIEGRRVILI